MARTEADTQDIYRLRPSRSDEFGADAVIRFDGASAVQLQPYAIRSLESQDVDEVARIWNLSIASGESSFGPEPLKSAEVHRLLLDVPPRFEAYVYEAEGTIVGWCALMRFYRRRGLDASAEFTTCVLPAHRRRGVGRALARHALTGAPKLGFHTLFLVLRDDPSYLTLWALRRDFTHIGRLTGVIEIGAKFHDLNLFQKIFLRTGHIDD